MVEPVQPGRGKLELFKAELEERWESFCFCLGPVGTFCVIVMALCMVPIVILSILHW